MKSSRLLIVLALLAPSAALRAHENCTCGTAAAPIVAAVSAEGADAATSQTEKADAPARHPLKGVVVGVRADRSALVVKHEEIPGVMKAMTMLLKVDAAGLAAAKKGDAVTGLLVRKSDGWWLEEVTKTAQ